MSNAFNLFNAFTSDPFRRDPFFQLLRAVDESFSPPAPGASDASDAEATLRPRVHVETADAATTVVVDLPGIDDDSVELDVEGDTLEIRARVPTATPDDAEPLRRERAPRSLAHTLRLTHRVDPASVGASLVDGVLTITLPRAAPTRRTIPINAQTAG